MMADASTINIAMSFPVYSGQIHARKRYLAESPCATHSLLTTLWLLYCPDAIRVSTHIIAFSMQLMWINRLGWHFPISRIPRPNKYSNMHIRDVGGIAQRLGSDAQGGGLNSLGEFFAAIEDALLARLIRILLLRGFNKSIPHSIAFERRPLYPLVPSPARLPDAKCHSSLHHSHSYSSFLALRSPRLFLRIVN